MKYGLEIINAGIYSDTQKLVELALIAEETGWDGLFLSDIIHFGYSTEDLPVNDAWIALAAIAARTERIKIGLQVTAPPRRRPWKMARETVTLDHLSNGRFILGVGSGDEGDRGFAAFGEEMNPKKRARMLDESLEILQGLWSGKPFRYSGEHYQVDEITFLPTPVQQPRIPIWIGGLWPNKKPMERAARFDGANFVTFKDGAILSLSPAETEQFSRFIRERRSTPFDMIAAGVDVFGAKKSEQALATLRTYADAGATWSLQRVWPEHDFESVRASIQQGPPSLSQS